MKLLHPTIRRGVAVLCLASTTGLTWAQTQCQPCCQPCPPAAAAGVAAATSASAPALAATSAAAAATVPVPAPISDLFVGGEVPTFVRSERYSAQRKPRVAVLDFEDTNASAISEIYKESVEAMLVTFLKRKSQLVVVERQRLGTLLDEWKLARNGRVDFRPHDVRSRELFEKIDALIVGSVTLLDVPPTGAQVAVGKPWPLLKGSERVEVDIKALGRADGRILAAAKSTGPIGCLRGIVDRLAVDLEQSLLRPYYGTLKFQLSSPETVRLFLTPILLDEALDEEKPPIERGESVVIEAERDLVQPWTTNPTSYTIENLLGGWYTVRLERPGYSSIGILNDNEDWLAHQLGDQVQVLYQKRGDTSPPVLLGKAPIERSRFVVHVDSREIQTLDGDQLRYAANWKKTGGSIAPRVRREHLDESYDHTPQRVVLIGKAGIHLNQVDRPREYAADVTCDLFEEQAPTKVDYGRTVVRAGNHFDFESFRGGDLVIEDYRGETIPTGTYQIAYWEPNYEIHQGLAVVNADDRNRPTQAALLRKSMPATFTTTGPRKGHQLLLVGEKTNHTVALDLDFDRIADYSLPVDRYLAAIDVPGLSGWQRTIDLQPADAVPPSYDLQLDERMEREARREARRRAREAERRRLGLPALSPYDSRLELPAAAEAFEDGSPVVPSTAWPWVAPWLGPRSAAEASLYWAGRPTNDESRNQQGDKPGPPPASQAADGRTAKPSPDDDPDDPENQLPKMALSFVSRHRPSVREILAPPTVRLKTRFAAAGRFDVLGSVARLNRENLFLDRDLVVWLDVALADELVGSGEETSEQAKKRILKQVGRSLGLTTLQVVAAGALQNRAGILGLTVASNVRNGVQPPAKPPAEDDPAEPAPPLHPALLATPAEARAELASRLADIDLLILDDQDLALLRDKPEVAAIIERYVEAGGGLYAYVAEPGDYETVVGAPLQLAAAGRGTTKLELANGETGLELATGKKAAKVGGKRTLVRPAGTLDSAWQVVAYTTPGRDPRIVERTGARGGYVTVWLDRPSLFRSRLLKKPVEGIEERRSKVEKYVLARTLDLAKRRYGAPSPPATPAIAPAAGAPAAPAVPGSGPVPATALTAGGTEARLKRLDDLLQQGLITREEFDRKRAEVLNSL
jgi:hypothetical protein